MKKTLLLTNERGSVVVLALIMLVLLTLLGMAVTRTSSIEVQIASNDQQAVDCLYTAESADHYAIELTNTWLTDAFLIANDIDAQVIIDDANLDIDGDGTDDANVDIDGDGTGDFQIEIRRIYSGLPHAGTLSTAANNLPGMPHISIPPIDSPYSLKKYEIRKFGITGTASNGCSIVQLGTYKAFNKFVE